VQQIKPHILSPYREFQAELGKDETVQIFGNKPNK
jgi:hypothetical protein